MTFELVNKQTGEVTFCGVPVTQRRPCEICGHPRNKRTGWCLRDNSRSLVICGHVPSPRKIGEAGYIHRTRGDSSAFIEAAARSVARPRQPFDQRIARELQEAMTPPMILDAARELGVSARSLLDMEVGWSSHFKALAFPMKSGYGTVVGVRLRKPDGFKFAVTGSRNGLFFPNPRRDGPVLLPEGPTDTAAVLTLGFDAVGRPFCRGGIEMLKEAFSRLRRPAVVIQDLDASFDDDGTCRHCGTERWCQHCRPGQFGAMATADALVGIAEWVKIIAPPPGIKDARQWLASGATRESIEYRIDQEALWQQRQETAA